jgi:integrase
MTDEQGQERVARSTRGRGSNGEPTIIWDEGRRLWRCRLTLGFDLDGQQIRKKVTGKTKADVKRKITEIVAATKQGRPAPDERITVVKFLAAWCDSLAGTVSAGTEDAYRRRARLYIVPHIGNIQLTKLAPTDVAAMLRALEARGLSAGTRRGVRATLRRALRRAEQQGLLVRNVAAIADGPKLDQTEGRYLTAEEARQLLRYLRDPPSRRHQRGRVPSAFRRLATAVVVQLSLGLRPGEVLGMRWSDVDIDGDQPHVRIAMQLQRLTGDGLQLVALKTRRSKRPIVLPAFIVRELRAHRRRQNTDRLALGPRWMGGDEQLVFTNSFGGAIEPRTYAKFLASACVAAGLGHRNPHALRHAAATIMLAEGVPLEVVSDVLGHSSIRITKDVYGHLVMQRQGEAAAAVERALGAAAE